MLNKLIKLGFYPSLAFNVLMEKLTKRQWYTKIDDTVIIGALPFKWMTKDLVENLGVKAVVSLNEDFELKLCNSVEEWEKHGVSVLRLPTLDFVASPSQTDLHTAVNYLMECRESKKVTYVHCKAGRTRSATVVACYLINVNRWTPSEAVSFLVEKRPHVWLRSKQMQALECFYKETVKVDEKN